MTSGLNGRGKMEERGAGECCERLLEGSSLYIAITKNCHGALLGKQRTKILKSSLNGRGGMTKGLSMTATRCRITGVRSEGMTSKQQFWGTHEKEPSESGDDGQGGFLPTHLA